MNKESKQKLEKLKKENKVRISKRQLIQYMDNWFQIDLSTKEFVDYDHSECIHKKVYKRIRDKDIIVEKFSYDYDILNAKINRVFNISKSLENNKVLFYPATFGYYFRSTKSLYLDFPHAITLNFKDCKRLILKLIHDTHDDLIVVDKNLAFGFVISEDEYDNIYIEYWGLI